MASISTSPDCSFAKASAKADPRQLLTRANAAVKAAPHASRIDMRTGEVDTHRHG